jgi:hypothetical protein
VSVELYIRDSTEVFFGLHEEKAAIEEELGMILDWLELPDQKSSRIVAFKEGSFDDAGSSEDLASWMVETADKFAATFGRYLQGAGTSGV